MMVTTVKDKIKRKKRSNTLTVVRVEHIQVPDAEERLSRVFRILLSNFEDLEKRS